MLHDVAWDLCWGGSWSTKPGVFPCKVAAGQAAMKGTSCVRRVRLRSFRGRIGSPLVFCKEWLFMCASFNALVECLVADCMIMAA